ncbi:MAG: hypothetical protein ACT6FE_02925 [Methanosarcinaceae archaeon]
MAKKIHRRGDLFSSACFLRSSAVFQTIPEDNKKSLSAGKINIRIIFNDSVFKN